MYNIFNDYQKEQLQKNNEELKKLNEQLTTATPESVQTENPDGGIDFITKKKKDDNFGLDSMMDIIPSDYTSDGKKVTAKPETETETKKTEEKEKPSNFLGTQGQNEMGSILGLAQNVATTATTKTTSVAQGASNILNTTMSGAQAGMAVGGPLGAAIGGGVGLIYSGIDTAMDMQDARRDKRNNYNQERDLLKTKREQDYRMQEGEVALSNLKKLREAQSNFSI
jgi:hypothetical protein